MTGSSDSQPIPPSKSKSRRALLGGALGGLGAWAATAITRASPVRATDGDIIHVGDNLSATASTTLANSTNHDNVFTALELGHRPLRLEHDGDRDPWVR